MFFFNTTVDFVPKIDNGPQEVSKAEKRAQSVRGRAPILHGAFPDKTT